MVKKRKVVFFLAPRFTVLSIKTEERLVMPNAAINTIVFVTLKKL